MKRIFLLFAFFFCTQVWSMDFYLGSGYTSSMRGRTTPILAMVIDGDSFGIGMNMAGVKNDIYYASYYNVTFHHPFKPISFLGGTARPAVGFGVHYNKIGYRENLTSALTEKASFQLGPSLRIHQVYLGFLYFGMDSIFGLFEAWDQISKITIVPAAIVSLQVGVTF
jgi:hypothetical protein